MPIDLEKVRTLCKEFVVYAEKMDELRTQMAEAKGEEKMAFLVVYNDYQWKMTNKVGQLWFLVCGTVSEAPFDVSKTTEEEMPALEKVTLE